MNVGVECIYMRRWCSIMQWTLEPEVFHQIPKALILTLSLTIPLINWWNS